ncbi:hypothetical protein [Marinimicrobium sp. ARAG 43.8]|uniref:hypothetical protein n=1 Tax=Marinimicrobium sp. ARAG 43.8 TaxID=3418719 RepID=UPI003CED378D
MDIDEVPQDKSSTYAGHKKVLYARDRDGRYTSVSSSGWEVEARATLDAVEQYRDLARQALEAVRAGRRSPLYYHLYSARMEPALLASMAGVGRLRLWWHLKPGPFERLSEIQRKRYAEVLNLSVEQLSQVPE